MTYLHDYVSARNTLREKVIPKMIAALMPTLDFLGYKYEVLKEGLPAEAGMADSLIVELPEGMLPKGYKFRIDFSAIQVQPWKAPNGEEVKGPGF